MRELTHLATILNTGHDACIMTRRASKVGINRLGMSLHRVTSWGMADSWRLDETMGAGDTLPMVNRQG